MTIRAWPRPCAHTPAPSRALRLSSSTPSPLRVCVSNSPRNGNHGLQLLRNPNCSFPGEDAADDDAEERESMELMVVVDVCIKRLTPLHSTSLYFTRLCSPSTGTPNNKNKNNFIDDGRDASPPGGCIVIYYKHLILQKKFPLPHCSMHMVEPRVAPGKQAGSGCGRNQNCCPSAGSS